MNSSATSPWPAWSARQSRANIAVTLPRCSPSVSMWNTSAGWPLPFDAMPARPSTKMSGSQLGDLREQKTFGFAHTVAEDGTAWKNLQPTLLLQFAQLPAERLGIGDEPIR